MKTERAESIVAGAILAWVAFFLIITTVQIQHWDSDIFWALRSGQWILDNWKVPATDPFSYTFYGKAWVDFTWGFQVIAHLFYTRLGGWTGLFILQLLITSLTFAALFVNVRLLTERRLWLLCLLMILTLSCAFTRFFIRPHLFGFLFISLYLLILNMNERRERFGLIFLILPLQILWVNIHSSAILGIFIVWAYASGEFIDVFLREGFKGFPAIISSKKRLILLAVIIPFATLINPYGLKLAIFPFIHQGGLNSDALRHIAEWSMLPYTELFFYFFPAPVDYFAFKLLFYFVIISFWLNRRSIRTRDIMLFAGSAYMGITHARWIGQFAFFAAPLIAFNMSGYMRRRGGNFGRLRLLGLAVALFISIFMGFLLKGGDFAKNFGIGTRAGDYPAGSVKFMKDNQLRGNIYNAYVFGGYLILKYPEVKVFIDGRTPTVYSPLFFWKARHTEKKADWERLETEYGITMALVKQDRSICKILYESKDWRPVVFDDLSILYLKEKSGYGDIIKKYGLSFSPCSVEKNYKVPKGKKERLLMKDELRRVMRSIEDGKEGMAFAYPHRLMGLVEGRLDDEGHKERAVTELQKAVSLNRDAFTFYDLGLALGKLKKYDEAIQAFKTSISLDRGFKRAYLAMGLAYFDKKDFGNTVKWLEKYLRHADDKASFLALKTLGWAYFKLGRLDMAEEMLKRSVFLAEKKNLGDVQYYIGNTLFEAGRFDEGALYYRRAMANDSGYEKVLKNLVSRVSPEQAAAIKSILDKGPEKE